MMDFEPPDPPVDPPKRPSYSDALLLNGAIVLFGLVGACAIQFIIAPAAIAASFGLAISANMGSNSEAVLLLLGFNLLFNAIVLAIVGVVSFVVKRLWLLQGWVIGALIGFLLYCACFNMLMNG